MSVSILSSALGPDLRGLEGGPDRSASGAIDSEIFDSYAQGI